MEGSIQAGQEEQEEGYAWASAMQLSPTPAGSGSPALWHKLALLQFNLDSNSQSQHRSRRRHTLSPQDHLHFRCWLQVSGTTCTSDQPATDLGRPMPPSSGSVIC